MTFIALGINHDTASVEMRERLAFDPANMIEALQDLLVQAKLDDAVILSTCNRTEVLVSAAVSSAAVSSAAVSDVDVEQADVLSHASKQVLHWLASYKDVHVNSVQDSVYIHQGNDALLHMMKVASGLDSMILGEPQILGQMKSAYAVAKDAGTLKGALDAALQYTFSYAKKVRTETAIGKNPVSVAYACVHLAQRIFSDLSHNKALLIGAGETIDLVAKHLKDKGIGSITVANRTLARAHQLAEQYNAEAILLGDIAEKLEDVDIVISSTASSLPILGKGTVERALKKRKSRPMFMIDIAVPRDIEPEVGRLRDVYLYTVDDLRDIIDENRKAREEEAEKAQLILEQGVTQFEQSVRANSVGPYIKQYRQQVDAMCEESVKKALNQLSGGKDAEQVLEQLAKQLSNKILYQPLSQLRQAGESQDAEAIKHIRDILGIDAP